MNFPKTLGSRSLSSILKLLLDCLYYVLWLGLGLTSLILLIIIVSGIYRVTGIGPSLPEGLLAFLQLGFVMSIPLSIITLVAFTFIVHRLRRIFATLIAGDPFIPENAGHLRLIAIALIIYQVTRYTATGVVNLLISVLGPSNPGEPVMASQFSINLGVWFAVLAFFVLSEVFREGARLREEQKLTI